MSERCGVLLCARNLVTELQSFFHINTHADGGVTVICLVWCVCTWTDLWRMVALKTDQVMEEKLEASGFMPGWFMRWMCHMMLSVKSAG